MIEIKEINPTSTSELKKFTQFQIDLYKGNAYYVPPLITDDVRTLDKRKNPAFEVCDAAYFMAYRDGRPVGRIAVIINRQANADHGHSNARFGFIDFVDEPEVSAALMKRAEEWARARGMKRLIGPLGFTDMDHEGMLVEGFEELSTMATIYNYPYYPRHLEDLGYRKESDWVEFLMDVPDGIPERYGRIADLVKRKYGLRNLHYTSRTSLKDDYGKELFELINRSYKNLYEYSRLTDKQIDYYIGLYLGLLDLDLVSLVVDAENKLVGVGISMGSMSRALQKSHGRMLPFGWWHLLKGLKGKKDRVDLMLVAIAPEYQGKGVNALLFTDLIPQYIKKGFRYAESNPELETNSKVQNQWDYFPHRQHRRRRAYGKDL